MEQQGGHLTVGGGHGSHTQDFIYNHNITLQILNTGQTSRALFTWTLGDLTGQATLFQMYKLNSITLLFTRPFISATAPAAAVETPFTLSAAPYSRANSAIAANIPDPRSIVGGSTRSFISRIRSQETENYSKSSTTPHCTTLKPMPALPIPVPQPTPTLRSLLKQEPLPIPQSGPASSSKTIPFPSRGVIHLNNKRT